MTVRISWNCIFVFSSSTFHTSTQMRFKIPIIDHLLFLFWFAFAPSEWILKSLFEYKVCLLCDFDVCSKSVMVMLRGEMKRWSIYQKDFKIKVMLTRDLKNEYQGTKNTSFISCNKDKWISLQPVQLDNRSSFLNYSRCFRKISKFEPYVSRIQFRHQKWMHWKFIMIIYSFCIWNKIEFKIQFVLYEYSLKDLVWMNLILSLNELYI